MRVVADTNTVVSGFLWHGAPREVLAAARTGSLQLFTSAVLLIELEDVLGRDKLSRRLALANVSARDLVIGYASLATPVTPLPIEPVILADPDDDAVLACALAAHADVIVSGDRHLLSLKTYKDMSILTAPELIARITEKNDEE